MWAIAGILIAFVWGRQPIRALRDVPLKFVEIHREEGGLDLLHRLSDRPPVHCAFLAD
jgi:hypothetical protein